MEQIIIKRIAESLENNHLNQDLKLTEFITNSGSTNLALICVPYIEGLSVNYLDLQKELSI